MSTMLLLLLQGGDAWIACSDLAAWAVESCVACRTDVEMVTTASFATSVLLQLSKRAAGHDATWFWGLSITAVLPAAMLRNNSRFIMVIIAILAITTLVVITINAESNAKKMSML